MKPYHEIERSEFFDTPDEFDISVDSTISDITDPAVLEKRSHLGWGEHCVQCSPPECHVTCDMYLPRDEAGHCRRFQFGITKTRKFATLQEFSDDIVFLPWSNLLAPVKEQPAQYDGFLLRIHNPNHEAVPFLFYLKNTSDEIRFMVRKEARPGPNQYFFPVNDIARYIPVDEFQGVFIAPDVRDRTRLYFEFHDFVKFKPGFMADAGINCVAFDLALLFHGADRHSGFDENSVVDVRMLTYLRMFAAKNVQVVALTGVEAGRAERLLKTRGIDNVRVVNQRSDEPDLPALIGGADGNGVHAHKLAYVGGSPSQRAALQNSYPNMTVIEPDGVFLLLFAFYDRRELSEIFEREAKLANAAQQRANVETSFDGTEVEFIRDSETVVAVEVPRSSHLDRVQDIVQLSNRLNFSNHRYSRAEISALFDDQSRYLCRVISASDRFGDFGIIGLFIVDASGPRQWLIKDLMLSCAVAGRHIDAFVLCHILELAVAAGMENVALRLSLSTMNDNAEDALDRCGFEFKHTEDQDRYYLFDLTLNTPRAIEYIRLAGDQGADNSNAASKPGDRRPAGA